jgi:hypothetical protein
MWPDLDPAEELQDELIAEEDPGDTMIGAGTRDGPAAFRLPDFRERDPRLAP